MLWQGWANSTFERKREKEKAIKAVMKARALESLYETITIPHPEIPKTWIVKKVRKK
jgi:hypothetical protein